jgi:hypothetical protein
MDALIDNPKKPLHRKLMNLILRGGMGAYAMVELNVRSSVLKRLLEAPRFQELIKINDMLAAYHVRLAAAHEAKHAMERLTLCMDDGSPEVRRRAATTILQLAQPAGDDSTPFKMRSETIENLHDIEHSA